MVIVRGSRPDGCLHVENRSRSFSEIEGLLQRFPELFPVRCVTGNILVRRGVSITPVLIKFRSKINDIGFQILNNNRWCLRIFGEEM